MSYFDFSFCSGWGIDVFQPIVKGLLLSVFFRFLVNVNKISSDIGFGRYRGVGPSTGRS